MFFCKRLDDLLRLLSAPCDHVRLGDRSTSIVVWPPRRRPGAASAGPGERRAKTGRSPGVPRSQTGRMSHLKFDPDVNSLRHQDDELMDLK